jgi:PST family polysaccharide transporter
VLFSDEFSNALYLYAPQLLGDVIKVMSFILSFIMLAKAMTRLFILSEVFFSLTYVAWVYFLTEHFGLVGAMYAFVVNYAIYFLFSFVVARRFIASMNNTSVG